MQIKTSVCFSSLNKPFGSGIVTPSGILLNSQILDFSWTNKTQGSSPNPVIATFFVSVLMYLFLTHLQNLSWMLFSFGWCSITTSTLGKDPCPS